MGCGKSAAADDLARYESLCRKHGLEPKSDGLYSYDIKHERFVQDLERGLSTVEAAENARLREIAWKEAEIQGLELERGQIDSKIQKKRSEIAELAKEIP